MNARKLAAAIGTVALLIAMLPASVGATVAGAGFTTDDPGITDACLNGQPDHTTPDVNCNLYGEKADVWINGGPSGGQNSLTASTYFFPVLEQGRPQAPNDGA